MTKKDLLFAYLYNKSVRLENEYEQALINFYWRRPDEVDCLEIIIAKIRLDSYTEMRNEIYRLIG